MWRIINQRNKYDRDKGIGWNLQLKYDAPGNQILPTVFRCYCFDINSGKTIYEGPERSQQDFAKQDAKQFIATPYSHPPISLITERDSPMQVHVVAGAIDQIADAISQSSVLIAEKLLVGKVLSKNQHRELLDFWELDRQKMRKHIRKNSGDTDPV